VIHAIVTPLWAIATIGLALLAVVAFDVWHRTVHPDQCIRTTVQRWRGKPATRATCGHARCDDVIHATVRQPSAIPPPPIPLEAAPQHRQTTTTRRNHP